MKKLKKGQVINEDQKKQLLVDYNGGMSTVSLITKYGVTQSRIYQILAEWNAMGEKVNYK